ncbi:NADH-quinone oxidoreductase subunit NuoN [Amycolatopsis sp. K13G38]|uniref:NADH-quinone oxidoreductase subunit N n=1 Tax=Amycolatopsis acididurans TaxID=2724524 RepID=A0ABX1J3I1_9PSEU|nr:NADH-quinone oxidoreductase subunit NuoN [Amycolatopsis acididurans]
MLVVFAAGVLGVLVTTFAPREARHRGQLTWVIAGLAAALGCLVFVAVRGECTVTAAGSIVVDGPALFLQGAALVLAILAVLLIAGRGTEPPPPESLPLTMFAVGGLLLLPAANDLLTMFVAVEVLSLPLYLLCGLARVRATVAHEASLKYFVLGGFSAAFFVYGAAMVYGFAGSVAFPGIRAAVASGAHRPLLLIGMALLAVGLLFKIGAAPFHSWVPDVYQGAPTAVTGLLAAVTKIGAFGAFLRLFTVAFGGAERDWRPVLTGVAVLTMVLGVVIAVAQQDVKRMLGYSAVAHAGFMLLGVVAASRSGIAGTLFYLTVYGCGTLGAFALVTLVHDSGGETTRLASWAGLGRRSPVAAGIFAVLLLGLAGIPLTGGFVGKFAVFSAVLAGGGFAVVIVAALASAVAVFFYARVIVLMFFHEPRPDGAVIIRPGARVAVVIAVAGLVTVGAGVAPGPLLGLAGQAASFLR